MARQVAQGAVRYDVVKVSADKATVFDWKAALDFDKLSAPFIQYSHARACSILRKAGTPAQFNSDLLTGENEIALIKKISEFDSVIERAARDLKPHQLATIQGPGNWRRASTSSTGTALSSMPRRR